jgi:hypothetical protein
VRVRTQDVTVAPHDRVALRHDRPSATAFPLSGDVTVAETSAHS